MARGERAPSQPERRTYWKPWERGKVVLRYENMSPGLKALVDEIAVRRGARDVLTSLAMGATDVALFPAARNIAARSPALGKALLGAAALSVAGGVYSHEGEKVREATMDMGQKLRDKLNERFDQKARSRVKSSNAISNEDMNAIINSGARLMYVNRNKALVMTTKVPLIGYLRVPLYPKLLNDRQIDRLERRRSLPKET